MRLLLLCVVGVLLEHAVHGAYINSIEVGLLKHRPVQISLLPLSLLILSSSLSLIIYYLKHQ